jgi:acetyltransferase-like isoleucine patch superfamily enzyme
MEPYGVSIGDHVQINENVILNCRPPAEVIIGNNVIISYNAVILTASLDPIPLSDGNTYKTATVVIEDAAWIGAGAIILTGFSLGESSIITA